MKVYNRQNKSYENLEQYGEGKLEFLYNNTLGRMFLKLAVSPLVSKIYGMINSRRSSIKKIPSFIKKQGIDMDDYEDRDYISFNDFFIRKIRPNKRPIDMTKEVLISPADSKLLVYRLDERTRMKVKGRDYTADEILGLDADIFRNGYALVFRLSMDNYHRYCFPDSGSVVSKKKIKGRLHTVSSISKDHKIYRENYREVDLLKTDHFGMMAFVEVGALLVGKIVNHELDTFSKGQEKGFFEPGGSTIIMFVGNNIQIDEDILTQSVEGIETKVLYGEKVGTLKC